MTTATEQSWHVIALRQQVIEGGITVRPGEEIPAEVHKDIGMAWFRTGYLAFVGVVPEEEIERRRMIDLHNGSIGPLPDAVQVVRGPAELPEEVRARLAAQGVPPERMRVAAAELADEAAPPAAAGPKRRGRPKGSRNTRPRRGSRAWEIQQAYETGFLDHDEATVALDKVGR